MSDKSVSFELLEPTSPEALVPDSRVELWMIVTVIVLVLAIAVFIAFRRKKVTPTDPLAVRNAAYQEAATGLGKISAQHSREAAVQASLILRRYLSVAANDPALFETHEEFISRHDALSLLTDEARAASETGFSRMASLKYAAEVPDSNPAEVIADAKSLLETLHHGFRE